MRMVLIFFVGLIGGIIGGYLANRSGGMSKGLYKYLAIGILAVLVMLFFIDIDIVERGFEVRVYSKEQIISRFKRFSSLLSEFEQTEKKDK